MCVGGGGGVGGWRLVLVLLCGVSVLSSQAIISLRKREIVALLYLHLCCCVGVFVLVPRLFLTVP